MARRAIGFSLGAIVCGWCAAATPPDADFENKLQEMRAKVGAGFRVAMEKPFVVVSDQSAEDFERTRTGTIRWAVRMLKKDFFDKDPERVMVIYLFDGDDSYRGNVKKFFDQTPTTPYGYYSREHDALVMNIATGGGTLVHEMVHPLMEANFPRCPAWFNEGMGSLFEACREQEGHPAGLINWRLPVLKNGIRDGHFVPLRRLLSTTSEEFYTDPHGMHYAESRYLCYYLQEQGKLREFYRRFAADTEKDPCGISTLCDVLGVGQIEEVEKPFLAFIENLHEEH